MVLGTYMMLGVCLVWFVALFWFLFRDLRGEREKSELMAKGVPPDPFHFSGERARAEAREAYLEDAVVRQYFEEIDIVPFLRLDGRGSDSNKKE